MIVCAASNNAGKLKELRRILERMGHEVKSLRGLGIDLDPEETGTTFAENARIKAEAFCKASGLPTVADDRPCRHKSYDSGDTENRGQCQSDCKARRCKSFC